MRPEGTNIQDLGLFATIGFLSLLLLQVLLAYDNAIDKHVGSEQPRRLLKDLEAT